MTKLLIRSYLSLGGGVEQWTPLCHIIKAHTTIWRMNLTNHLEGLFLYYNMHVKKHLEIPPQASCCSLVSLACVYVIHFFLLSPDGRSVC